MPRLRFYGLGDQDDFAGAYVVPACEGRPQEAVQSKCLAIRRFGGYAGHQLDNETISSRCAYSQRFL